MDHRMAMLAARTLVRARRSGERIDALPDGAVPASEEEAYQILRDPNRRRRYRRAIEATSKG